MAGLALTLGSVSGAVAGEWERIRESYDGALKTYEKRIGDIEAKERDIQDPERRAEKITGDKIAATRVSLKSGGKGKSLADAAERSAADSKSVADLSKEQGEYLDVATNDWGAEGAERKKLREAITAAQKNFERVNANLAKAAKSAASISAAAVLDKAIWIEASVDEAGERLKARWQLEQAAREREAQARQRERDAAERMRGTR